MQAINKNNKYKVTVTQQGVEVDNNWYNSPKLLMYSGQKVVVCLNPMDKGHAFVFQSKPGSDALGQYICAAECMGFTSPIKRKRQSYLSTAEVLHLHHYETVSTLRAVIDSVCQREELGATLEEAELVVAQLIEELLFIKTETLASKLALIRGQGDE